MTTSKPLPPWDQESESEEVEDVDEIVERLGKISINKTSGSSDKDLSQCPSIKTMNDILQPFLCKNSRDWNVLFRTKRAVQTFGSCGC